MSRNGKRRERKLEKQASTEIENSLWAIAINEKRFASELLSQKSQECDSGVVHPNWAVICGASKILNHAVAGFSLCSRSPLKTRLFLEASNQSHLRDKKKPSRRFYQDFSRELFEEGRPAPAESEETFPTLPQTIVRSWEHEWLLISFGDAVIGSSHSFVSLRCHRELSASFVITLDDETLSVSLKSTAVASAASDGGVAGLLTPKD